MRIIAGRFRSRRLLSPKDDQTTRPIPDRVKESVFSMLRGNCQGAQVLDCFAGTGAIGLEALSRGAERVVFIERDRRAFEMLEKNVALLGVEDESELVRGDALGPAVLTRCPSPVDLIFFDPPYPIVLDPLGWPRIVKTLERLAPMLSDEGYIVLRTPWPLRHIDVLDPNGRPLPKEDRAMFDVFGRYRPEWAERRGPDRRGGGRPKGRDDEVEPDRLERRAPRGPHGDKRSRRPEPEHEDELRGDEPYEQEWIGADLDALEIQRESDELLAAQRGEVDPDGATESLLPPEVREPGDQDPAEVPFKFRLVKSPLELRIAGTIGPETHTYTSQAVHLFMRDRGQAASPEKE